MGLRKTGIEAIGDVSWGTHISQVYSSKDDFIHLLAPYIKEGLMNNELCVWIYSENSTYQEIKETIESQVINTEEFINSGQLKIISYKDWYVKDNAFNEVRVSGQWIAIIKDALSRGFDGLRAIADTAWLEKSYSRSFHTYEQGVNEFFSELPFIVICLYDINKISAEEFVEIVKNHSYVITSDNGELKLLKNVELLIKSKQLEQSKEDYERLLQFLPDAVFIHNKERILYCNQAAARITGMEDLKKIMEKSIPYFIANDKRKNYEKFADQMLKGDLKYSFLKSKLVDAKGNSKDVEVTAANCAYNGFPSIISVVRDVSHIKRIRELERDIERNKALLNETLKNDGIKTEFFSNVSHELRTPLNVILSALELIETYKESGHIIDKDKEKKYLKMMRQNCYRLLRLINNLIDITKIDSNFFKLNLRNCDIVKVIKDITLSISSYLDVKGVKLQFETNKAEKIIACDLEQMERIILNLLSNAIKFTPSGGNILVKLVDCGEKMIISVRDSGIGISGEYQKIIFDRFQQGHKSDKKQNEGSGIGLSLVKSIVEKHKGIISVNSEPGKGSEFIVEIPCRVLREEMCASKVIDEFDDRNYVERAKIEFSDIYY